jgi:hypothetical protein
MAVTRIKPLYDQTGKLKGYVDKYSGEEFGFPVIVGRKRNPYGKGWIMNSQEALEIVAKDRDIKGETYRVLFFICARLDFENWVQLPVIEIAKALGMHHPDVSKAMKVLEDKQIILRGPKVGRSHAFMLNPDFGWKGKVTNLEDYRRKEWDDESKRLKIVHSNDEILENLKINQLSQEFDISTERLKELLSSLRNLPHSPA